MEYTRMDIERLESKLGMFSGKPSSPEILKKFISDMKNTEKNEALNPVTKRMAYADIIQQYFFDSELSLNQIMELFDGTYLSADVKELVSTTSHTVADYLITLIATTID